MRLLKRDNTGKFSLTSRDLVKDDKVPRYAILSHTWGEDSEEVSFKDMMDGTGTSKPGYYKIQFCGEQRWLAILLDRYLLHRQVK